MSAEDRILRLVRAAVFATVCVVISSAGHTFAGGAPIRPDMVVMGTLGALGLAYTLNGRERGPEVVLAASMGAQIALHELFAATSVPMTVVAGPRHGHLTFGMTLLHLTLAAITGWWLYRGESAAWLMLRLWRMPFPALSWLLPCVATAFLPPPSPLGAGEPWLCPVADILPALHRRGPPVRPTAG
ncbi:hypothetical protein ACFFWE_10900 [Sphaerisporangium melleum]|uniref:hypothetical protein n=1 Tax=Sphaerisporangium melleum TaxID=321316 RepID=UPI001E2DEF2D|nr:hypothetical protein [Sphaerisporangium melleum]